MIIISIIFSIVLFIFLFLLFYLFNIKINNGILVGFFIFFDFYGFILSKLFPFITPLIFILLISIFVILYNLIKNFNQFLDSSKNIIIKLWLLFLLFLILSLIWTPNKNYGFFKIEIFLIRGLLPGLALYYNFYSNKKLSWNFSIISGLLYVLMFLFIKQDEAYFTHRMTIQGGNPIWLARSFFIFVMIVIFNKNLNIYIKIIFSLLGIYAGLITQSKGPFLAFISAIFIFYLYNYINKEKVNIKKVFKITIEITFLIILLFVSVNIIIKNFEFLNNTRFAALFDIKKLFSEPTFLERVVRINKSLRMFFSNFIIGNGIGGYSLTDQRNYPHNIILEILAELGLIGISIWSIIIYKILKLVKNNKFYFILFTQTLIYTMFSGDLGFNIGYVLVSFIILAIVTTNNGEINGNSSIILS